jgi:predicted nucleic acid-binding protein
VIVADTGAIVALVDADDKHHRVLLDLFQEDPDRWVVPWAVLPEADYLIASLLGVRAQEAFASDLSRGVFRIEWGDPDDLNRAHELGQRYKALRMGLVDGVVMAVAERLEAEAIATLDLRHFGAVSIRGGPKLLPRDAKAGS